MNSQAPVSFVIKPRLVNNIGKILLLTGLVVSLTLVLILAYAKQAYFFFFPLVLLGSIGVVWVFQNPTRNLFVVLSSFIVISNSDTGLAPEEALYILYFCVFLAVWYFKARFLDEKKLALLPTDFAILSFQFWLVVMFVLGIGLFHGNPKLAISEYIWYLLFLFYFPVQKTCISSPETREKMIWILVFWGVVTGFRTLINYREVLLNAVFEWQIARGRVHINERILVIAGLACLLFILYDNRWLFKILFYGFFIMMSGALIITQGRGIWIEFILGVMIFFFFLDRPKRKTLFLMLFFTGLVAIGGSIIVLGDTFFILLGGLLERVGTIATATSKDISVINRFYETEAVLGHISKNPIIGYGFGVNYRVFDIISDVTIVKSFIHNGFLVLWYKFGIIGLGLMLFFWFSSILSGVKAFKRFKIATGKKQMLLAFTGLIIIIPGNVANSAFMFSDSMLLITILSAIATSGYLSTRTG